MDTFLMTLEDNPLLKQILDTMADGVFTLDTNGKIISWSKAMEQISGFTAEEAIGQPCKLLNFSNCLGISGPGDSKKCEVLQGKVLGVIECFLKHKLGVSIPIIKNATAIKDEHDNIIGIIEAITDVSELEKARDKVQEANRRLREVHRLDNIIGNSPAMQGLFSSIKAASESDVTVLVQGESGTGKELVVGSIHYNSKRASKPFVIVNCSALSESLLESELFGHVKGSFTGAVNNRMGRLEEADTGTIFLDEIGELSPLIQVKLLRVLQEKEIERIGESKKRKLDIRIITATHRNLVQLIKKGLFRQDLYYRLKVFTVQIPSLKERKTDIPLLINYFIDQQNKKTGKSIQKVAVMAMRRLMDYTWSGNVRELEHAIEHAFVLCDTDTISLTHLPLEIREEEHQSISPEDPMVMEKPDTLSREPLSRESMIQQLHKCQWNKAETARRFHISRTTVWKHMKQWDIPLKPPE